MNIITVLLSFVIAIFVLGTLLNCIDQRELHKESSLSGTKVKVGRYKDFKHEFEKLINNTNYYIKDNGIFTHRFKEHISEYLSDSALNINTNEFKFNDCYMYMKNPISIVMARRLIEKRIKNNNKIEKWS